MHQHQAEELARAGRAPQTLRQIGHAGGVLHLRIGGQAQVDADTDDSRRRTSATGRKLDKDARQLASVHQHVVGPLELHPVDAQLFQRPRHGEPGHQGQAGRHRRAGGEAPQGRKGQTGARPGLPHPPTPPTPRCLHIGRQHMHAPVIRRQLGQKTAIGGIALRQEHQ